MSVKRPVKPAASEKTDKAEEPKKKWSDGPIPKVDFSKFQTPSKAKVITRIFDGVLAAMVVASIGLVWYTQSQASDLQSQLESLNKSIISAKADVAKLNKIEKPAVSDVRNAISSAAKDGNMVADLQNKYKNYNPQTQEGDIKANAKKIGTFMDTDSTNAQALWYMGYNLPNDAKWRFMSSFSFAGKTADVIWQFKDDMGNIYAYTTGQYNAATRKFSNMQTSMTSLGLKKQDDGSEAKANKKAIQDLVTKMQNSGVAQGNEKPQDMSDIERARMQAAKEAEGGK